MRSLWAIEPDSIRHLRSPGGDKFTRFVDDLIRAQAATAGVVDSDVVTNRRTNLGDGGVDTEVKRSLSVDPTGRFAYPTCWQFKAVAFADVTPQDLRDEVNKPYASELIRRGYAYRFAICDSLTAEKKRTWEDEINAECRKLNPSAAPAFVVTTDDLAAWANRFPFLVSAWFAPEGTLTLPMAEWQGSTRGLTPAFAQVREREGIAEALARHATFNITPHSAVFTVLGEAGVGKTRLVYEALSATSGASQLVGYTLNEEAAESIVYRLVGDRDACGILVADECRLETRVRLEQLASGCKGRIRIIAIDIAGLRGTQGEPDYHLSRMDDRSVERILDQNFPGVPQERRRSYAGLARGFVRLAADLCNYDPMGSGELGPALVDIDKYYAIRLTPESQWAVEALSLLPRVGYRDDKAGELDALAGHVGLDRRRVVELSTSLKNVPGFVAFAGRYLYVTPQVIAQVAFARAWDRWIAPDPERFLGEFPAELLPEFLRAVERNATKDVRRVVGEFFRKRAARLTPAELLESGKVEQLAQLIAVDPDSYLPVLTALLKEATPDQIAMRGPAGAGKNTRRTVVWLLERLLRFPECYKATEEILFRLAIHESEPDISNNATGIWTQSFGIFLSGTPVPYLDRLSLLEARVFAGGERELSLGVVAIERSLNVPAMFRVNDAVLGTRVPPPEWRPADRKEFSTSEREVLGLLFRMSQSEWPAHRSAAMSVVLRNLRRIVAKGHLAEAQRILGSEGLDDEVLPTAVESIEDFLTYDVAEPGGTLRFPPEYVEAARRWLRDLPGSSFHSRLVNVVGKDRWRHLDDASMRAWDSELRSLAGDLTETQSLLDAELAWLSSAQARSAFEIGGYVGERDSTGTLLSNVVHAARVGSSTSFGAGYISGLTRSNPLAANAIKLALDQIPREAAGIVLELALASWETTNALARALAFVAAGDLPVAWLGAFRQQAARGEMNAREIRDLLVALNQQVKQGRADAARIATELIAFAFPARSDRAVPADLEPILWETLELTAHTDEFGSHFWKSVLELMAPRDLTRGTEIAATALVSGNMEKKDSAEEFLAVTAGTRPDLVMAALGKRMLDEDTRVLFHVDRFAQVVASLPSDVVHDWLRDAGVIGARRIARHLPLPFLGPSGETVVPEVTALVFGTFEDDDATFREFCLGAHSFQMYSGDIAAQKAAEAEVARRFLDHELRRVREWAAYEMEQSSNEAKRWRQEDEEFGIG